MGTLLGFLEGLVLRLLDLIVGKLTGGPKVQVQIRMLSCDFLDDVITPWPSRYFVEADFSNAGNTLTTITSISLVIEGVLKLSRSNFKPLELKAGGFQRVRFVFPVEKERAITEGRFELVALDTFGKEIKVRGSYPLSKEENML